MYIYTNHITTYILYINIKNDKYYLSHILLVMHDRYFMMHDRYFIFTSWVRGGGGGIRLPLSICLSVRPSVCHTLWCRVCVINSSHSYLLKPYILNVNIKMCMCFFLMALELILTQLWPLELRCFWHFFCILGYINSSYSFQ